LEAQICCCVQRFQSAGSGAQVFTRGAPAAAMDAITIASNVGVNPRLIVAAGTPEEVARAPGSVTGPWLAEQLGLQKPSQPGEPRARSTRPRA